MRMDALRASTGSHARSVNAPAEGPRAALVVPEWVKDAVFYQIFPDRFANGDIGNDPPGTLPWGSQPTNDAIMGGDLVGVKQRLGYLARLGVNALYFNPVMSAKSNHRYDVTDFQAVDERLGGDDALRDLVKAAHGKNMKVMLDGVFNHTSHQHPWFRDVRQRGSASPWFNWFDVTSWPITYTRDSKGVLRSPDYKSWWNYATLPELRTERADVREYFLTGTNAVVKRWIRDFGIDGWRMDVADEIEPEFWRIARREIKQTNPNAYVLAENWHDASSMLQGDQFDGAMNYKHFQQPAVSFFAHKSITADEFVTRLRNPYSQEARLGMFNILDSHDTPRFITEAGGDWYRLRPAAIFQMTYVGAPVVYYGTELGMEGAADPDSRRTFPWDMVSHATHPDRPLAARPKLRISPASGAKEDGRAQQLFHLYQSLIATRTNEAVLRRGDFAVLATHNDHRTVAFRRFLDGERRDAVIALNNDVIGHDIAIPAADFASDGTVYVDALSGTRHVVRNGQIVIPHIDGNFGAVLLREETKPS